MAQDITDATFDEIISTSSIPVLVDFWAKWCGPCRALAPIINEISKEYEGKLLVCKLEVDENPEHDAMFDIQTIPTLILFKEGNAVDKIFGVLSKEDVEKFLAPHI